MYIIYIQNQDTHQKELDLLTAIADGVEENCQCGFSVTYFANGGFQCFQGSAEGAVTYRTQLNVPQGSVDFVEQVSMWLSTRPSVALTGVLLRFDSACNLVIESFSDPECGAATEDLQGQSNSTALNNQLYIIIGGATGSATLILLCLLVIISCTVFLCRKKSKQYE